MLNILFIIVGIAAVLWGADRLTDGSVAVAQRMNIPQIVIGLTVVAMGTSMPEFFVSLTSALKGTADLAVGNIVGSNIFNTLVIVGVTAMVAPMNISRHTVERDLPFSMLASAMLLIFGLDNMVGRWESAILFMAFLLFMAYTLRTAAKGTNEAEQAPTKAMNPWMAALWIVIGLVCLVVGSNIFVSGATELARMWGVSEAVIGLTIVAGGTSLPELATSIVAAKKGQSAIAIGNVIGSNVFNVFMILGATGLIKPMQTQGITLVDLSLLLISAVLLWLFSFTRYKVERWEGGVLVLVFAAYLSWLLYNI
ncbi:MAG: calcium/sodium antiporter [Bacteroidaceae bacterium]|nr:calcium/sodium antiporter [Bacteroidaceae bacterium]